MSGGVEAARRAIVAACRRLDARGLIAGGEGNVSCRLPDGSVLVTPAGRPKRLVTPKELVRVPASALTAWLDGPPERAADHRTVPSERRPSSEFSMHAHCYVRHPDVTAVVHAHPPVATGTAGWPTPLPWEVLPEARLVIGGVAVAPAIEPGTPAVGRAVAAGLEQARAVLLTRHGATTVGGSVEEALARMESLEQAARVLVVDAIGALIARGTAR